MELATVTMAHATSAVLSVEDPPDKGIVKEIQLRAVLQVTVENVRKPSATHYMIDHALQGAVHIASAHLPYTESLPHMAA